MSMLSGVVADAEVLADYAQQNSIALPDGTLTVLRGAKKALPAISLPGPERDVLMNAIAEAVASIRKTASIIREEASRLEKMRPMVEGANRLLLFAAANGRKVDDSIRKPLVTVAAVVEGGGLPTVENELDFLRAYEGLTVAFAPITAESLETSSTLPTFESLRTLKGWLRLLRFLNILLFGVIMVYVCLTLSYYYQGASSMSRYVELHALRSKLEFDVASKRIVYSFARQTLAAQKTSTTREAEKASQDATQAVIDAEEQLKRAEIEMVAIPELLGKWADSACTADWSFSRLLLCTDAQLEANKAEKERLNEREKAQEVARISVRASAVARQQQSDEASNSPLPSASPAANSDTFTSSQGVSTPAAAGLPERLAAASSEKTFAYLEKARTVSKRLSDVYLPLLLGVLGAYAYVLRKISSDIATRSFTKGSFFNHFVRVGLGALAGLASTWLLTPNAVGGLLPNQEALAAAQFKTLPIWALAFVAGYGIELVFAFMDRIISAFTGKPMAPL